MMSVKPKKLLLVRHGAPEKESHDPGLIKEALPLLDTSVQIVREELALASLGRVVLLSSEMRRTKETAAYIGERLAQKYDVSDVNVTPLLGLDSALGRFGGMATSVSYDELSNFMSEFVDDSAAVIAVTHQPVIESISRLTGVGMTDGYGAVTVVR